MESSLIGVWTCTICERDIKRQLSGDFGHWAGWNGGKRGGIWGTHSDDPSNIMFSAEKPGEPIQRPTMVINNIVTK